MSMGNVTLVGAGPGDPELLTIKTAKEIARATLPPAQRMFVTRLERHAPVSERIGRARRDLPLSAGKKG